MNLYQRIVLIWGTIALLIFHFSISTAIVFDCKEHGFTITLPDNWIPFPQVIIDEIVEEMQKEFPMMQVPHYKYAYHLLESQDWINGYIKLPYILIDVNEERKMSEKQLENLKKINFSKLEKELGNKMKNLASNLTINEMVYDSSKNIIWMKGQGNVIDFAITKVLSGSIPTEKGFIQIACYAKENDYKKYEPIFIKIITSVNIVDESLRYKKRLIEEEPYDWEEIVSSVTGLIITTLLIYLALRFAFRKKSRNNEFDEQKDQEKCPTCNIVHEVGKYIGLKLCPNCNAYQDGRHIKCPECSYDISNIEITKK